MKSKKTTFEERLEIVKWVIGIDMSCKDTVDKCSNNYALVYKWTRGYIDKGTETLKGESQSQKLMRATSICA